MASQLQTPFQRRRQTRLSVAWGPGRFGRGRAGALRVVGLGAAGGDPGDRARTPPTGGRLRVRSHRRRTAGLAPPSVGSAPTQDTARPRVRWWRRPQRAWSPSAPSGTRGSRAPKDCLLQHRSIAVASTRHMAVLTRVTNRIRHTGGRFDGVTAAGEGRSAVRGADAARAPDGCAMAPGAPGKGR